MFFNFPVFVTDHIRQLSLLLNTVVLIVMLIAVEIIYSEKPKARRVQLRYFFPLAVILVGLLVYAAYLQGAKA